MDGGRSVEANSVSDVAAGVNEALTKQAVTKQGITKQGVGARLLRKEDDRLMPGRGQFVADIRLAGLQDVAFVRSPLAHARIRSITIPPQYKDSVFTAADLDGVKPIRAVS